MRGAFGAVIGIALGLLILAAPANAQFLTFVSATGNDANTCFVQAAPCKTLQRGINQTSPGGELRLLSSLVSNGFINKSMTVEGGYNTVIGTIAVNNASAIVRFRRLNLNGVNGFPTGFNLINAAAVHIEECSVERYTGDGILLASGVSTELFISSSVSRDNGSDGLDIGGPTTAKLSVYNSHFGNNVEFGTIVQGGEASVTGGVFFGNGSVGIYQTGGRTNITDSTAVANNASANFEVDGGEMTLESCMAGGGSNFGFFAGVSTVARISNCVFTSHGTGVSDHSGGATILTLENNLIAGNGTDLQGTLTPLAGE